MIGILERAQKVAQIAEVCHEANRAYCKTIGDISQVEWAKAPEWQRESARQGVQAILDSKVTTPRALHEGWLADKQAAGWTYGPVKDPSRKQHPCMVSYDELPEADRVKDAIFLGIVKALA